MKILWIINKKNWIILLISGLLTRFIINFMKIMVFIFDLLTYVYDKTKNLKLRYLYYLILFLIIFCSIKIIYEKINKYNKEQENILKKLKNKWKIEYFKQKIDINFKFFSSLWITVAVITYFINFYLKEYIKLPNNNYTIGYWLLWFTLTILAFFYFLNIISKNWEKLLNSVWLLDEK